MILELQEADKKVVNQPKELAELLQRLLRLEDTIDQDKEHFSVVVKSQMSG